MTDFYMDTDTGDDADNGTTWALAKLTLGGLLAVMSAGDTGWIQGAAADDSASDRTFTSPGTVINPCKITGVADGTTNEPPVLSDLASTLPIVSTTGAAPDINWSGSATYINIDFSSGDRLDINKDTTFIGCKLTYVDLFFVSGSSVGEFINCEIEPAGGQARIQPQAGSRLVISGGFITPTTQTQFLHASSSGVVDITGFDFSSMTSDFLSGSSAVLSAIIRNCKTPTTWALNAVQATASNTYNIKLIASSDTTSQAAGTSIQNYEEDSIHGNIVTETTIVRTNGADDGASGGFSYAMTPYANSTLESTNATLKSPWMSVWVTDGSTTLTVYICNDSASTDYLEDEAWCEFYTPDAGDTAQHDQNFDPADARLFSSSTAITDDTGSTWGTGGNNHQKFTTTVTTGFEGWAYARLHLAKRQATPDTLYLDPQLHYDGESGNMVTSMNPHGIVVSYDAGSGGGGICKLVGSGGLVG